MRWCLALLLLLPACKGGSGRNGVVIRNDIQDREYNEIVVDQVKASGMTQAKSWRLRPQEEVLLPYPRVNGFRVSRRYQRLTRVYTVTCPGSAEGVVIKLIDIHLNRMAGGCRLIEVVER